MTQRPRIFGFITTASSSRYTPHALQSFFRTTALDSDDQVLIIVNDGCLDESTLGIYPQCKIIQNSAPLGFAANMNQVLEQALESNGDALLLNNDLIFTSRWLEPLMDGDHAISSPLSNRELRYITNIINCNVVMDLKDYLGREEALNLIVEQHKKQNSGSKPVITVPFFCARIPFRVLDTVGLLDESYGQGGGEDYDYCLRAQLAGFGCRYALASYILHFGGKSSYDGGETSLQQKAREEHFMKVFRDRWGERLFQLILKDRLDIVSNDPNLSAEADRGNLKGIIEALLPG